MRKRILISICTLILGVFIYYLNFINVLITDNDISIFIRNYIPDFLWMVSFYFFSINYAKKITKKYIIATSIYVIALGLMFEMMQYSNIVKGTFDILDIITYIIAIIIANIVELLIWRYEDENKN